MLKIMHYYEGITMIGITGLRKCIPALGVDFCQAVMQSCMGSLVGTSVKIPSGPETLLLLTTVTEKKIKYPLS